MKKAVLASLFILGMLGSSIAQADRGGPGKFMHFFDANQDGTVTLDEFNEAASARFKRMDSDGNGKVSQDEFRDYVKSRRIEHKADKLKRIDTNGDGKVTEDEYIAYSADKAKRKFSRMDKNKDGDLSAEEMKNCKHHKRFGSKRIYHKLDGNNDGQITKEESYKAWSDWFTRIDANGDKVVSTDEVKAYREKKLDQHSK